MPNGSDPGNQCQAADRLERVAQALREMEVSDRTAGIIETQALLIQRILETSPDDQAGFAMALARAMGR